jgi:hypothetical protein
MPGLDGVSRIILPQRQWETISQHCRRKLDGDYLPGETKGPKACGLLVGAPGTNPLLVKDVFPLKKNVRNQEPYKSYMDTMMEQHAFPSKTPLSKRGWITDPEEMKQVYDAIDQDDLVVFGSYHMHIVPWKDDPVRDTPTTLDNVLAQGSNLFSFIVSAVDPSNLKIRAFYEGAIEKEVDILIQ